MNAAYPLDLVVLVADADQREILRALLDHRAAALGIRTVRHEILKHPRRDPGCRIEASAILQPYLAAAEHALVLFDREGCGTESVPAVTIANDVRQALADAGWGDRADVIVIDPELENWVWSHSPHVSTVLGWTDSSAPLDVWMRTTGLWPEREAKPLRPKESLESVLARTRIRRSAALYGELARKVSLKGCVDPAFDQLQSRLREWFGSMS